MAGVLMLQKLESKNVSAHLPAGSASSSWSSCWLRSPLLPTNRFLDTFLHPENENISLKENEHDKVFAYRLYWVITIIFMTLPFTTVLAAISHANYSLTDECLDNMSSVIMLASINQVSPDMPTDDPGGGSSSLCWWECEIECGWVGPSCEINFFGQPSCSPGGYSCAPRCWWVCP